MKVINWLRDHRILVAAAGAALTGVSLLLAGQQAAGYTALAHALALLGVHLVPEEKDEG